MLECELNEGSIEPEKSQKRGEAEEADRNVFEEKYGPSETRMLYDVFIEAAKLYFISKGIDSEPENFPQLSEDFIRIMDMYHSDRYLANSETNRETLLPRADSIITAGLIFTVTHDRDPIAYLRAVEAILTDANTNPEHRYTAHFIMGEKVVLPKLRALINDDSTLLE